MDNTHPPATSTGLKLTTTLRELERTFGHQYVIAAGTVGACHPTNRLYVLNAEQWAKLHRASRRCQELIEQVERSRDISSELWSAIDGAYEIDDAEESARILASMPSTATEDQGDLAASNDALELDVGEVTNASQVATQEFCGTSDELEYAMFGGRDLVERDVLCGSLSQRLDDVYNQV